MAEMIEPAQKWEYRIVTVWLTKEIVTLQECGEDGWELVAVRRFSDEQHSFFFKRPKPDRSTTPEEA